MSTEGCRVVDEEFEEKFLQCLICTERFDQTVRIPKLLPCHHTYCLPCVTKINQLRVGILKCPVCCKENKIGTTCKKLPNDHRVIMLLDWMSQAGAKLRNVCSKHSPERVYFFCETCWIPVCQQCTVLDHSKSSGHHINDLEQALTKHSGRLRDIEHNSREMLQQLQARRTLLKNSIKRLDTSEVQHKSEIKSKFAECHRILSQYEKDLNIRVSQRTEHQRDILQVQHDSIHEQAAQLQKLCDDLKSFTERNDVPKQFTTASEMMTQRDHFKQLTGSDDRKLSHFFKEIERAFRADMVVAEGILSRSDLELEDVEEQIDTLTSIQLGDFVLEDGAAKRDSAFCGPERLTDLAKSSQSNPQNPSSSSAQPKYSLDIKIGQLELITESGKENYSPGIFVRQLQCHVKGRVKLSLYSPSYYLDVYLHFDSAPRTIRLPSLSYINIKVSFLDPSGRTRNLVWKQKAVSWEQIVTSYDMTQGYWFAGRGWETLNKKGFAKKGEGNEKGDVVVRIVIEFSRKVSKLAN